MSTLSLTPLTFFFSSHFLAVLPRVPPKALCCHHGAPVTRSVSTPPGGTSPLDVYIWMFVASQWVEKGAKPSLLHSCLFVELLPWVTIFLSPLKPRCLVPGLGWKASCFGQYGVTCDLLNTLSLRYWKTVGLFGKFLVSLMK